MAGVKMVAMLGTQIALTTVISTAITIASTAYQMYSAKKQKKKMAADAEARKGFEVPVRGTIDYLPVIYGKNIVGGVEVAHKTNNNFPGGSGGTVFESGLGAGGETGSKNEFLGVQIALCHEGIEGVVDINVNESRYNYSKAKFLHRFHTYTEGGTADSAATSFGFPSTNLFTNCAWITAFYKLNRDDQNYSGLPSAQFIVKGQKVNTLVQSGSGGNYSYSLSATKVYSNNPAYCLLDYLLNEKYGRGLSLEEVDLQSFYHAAEICGTVVLGNATVGGRVNGVKSFQSYSSIGQFPNITSAPYAPATEDNAAEDLLEYLYKADDTDTLYEWNNGTYEVTQTNRRELPLYECNLSIDTASSIRNNIEKIMDTMGLAELTWSSEGKYKLLIEYPTDAIETVALVDPSHQFDEDSIIRSELAVSWPPANDRFNQVTVSFNNEHEDFKSDTVSWPPTSSVAYDLFLEEDNQQPFTGDLSGTGITDPYHALAKAEQTVRQSREMKIVSATVGKEGLNLEPGDFVSFYSPNASLGSYENGIETPEIFRVQSVRIDADLTAKIEAYRFSPSMLAWNVADDIPYESPPEFDFNLPDVTNVVSVSGQVITEDGTTVPFLDIYWDSTGAYQYEILYRKQNEPDSSFISVITRLTNYRISPVEKDVNYYVKVRAASATGLTGGFGLVTPVHTGSTKVTAEPSNLIAEGGIGGVKLTWVNSADTDLSHTEIWEGDTDDLNLAVKIAETSGDFFTRPNVGPGVRKYYWIRSVSRTRLFSDYIGPENSITLRIGADDIGASAVGWSNLESSVAGLENQYTVTLDNNGAITGYQLVSDENNTSAFNVRADQFNIYDTVGTDYPMFSVRSTSETISGVYYPSGVYIDGYLSADKIVADTLSAITADIGTVTAGTVTSAAGNMTMDLDAGTLVVRDESNNLRVKIGDIS